MPGWKDLLDETQAYATEAGSAFDVVRRKYLRRYAQLVGRNVIVYYSGWLQKRELEKQGVSFDLNDADKAAFIAVVQRMERRKGVDLFLHTPGGDLAATESIVDYLRKTCGADVRAVIPQVALSAGTILALACKELVMGAHSSIGPIDPRVAPGVSARAIIDEFEAAKKAIKAEPDSLPAWQAILANYRPSLVNEAVKAHQWARTLAHGWLVSGMLAGRPDADEVAAKVVEFLADHAPNLSPVRHISAERARGLGINVRLLEDPGQDKLQDAVLSVHHACMQTLTCTGAVKIVENQSGVSVVTTAPKT